MDQAPIDHSFTKRIVLGMLLGILTGLLIRYLPLPSAVQTFLVHDLLDTVGKIFVRLLRMLVIPVVLVSLVCGASQLGGFGSFGRVAVKSIVLYLVSTSLAITLALSLAHFTQIGTAMPSGAMAIVKVPPAPALKQVILNMFTVNPFDSLAKGNMLQIVCFSLLLGVMLTRCGEAGEKAIKAFQVANTIVIRAVLWVMKLAPVGVFALLAVLLVNFGWHAIVNVLGYCGVLVLTLVIQLFVVYSLFLWGLTRLNPWVFFKKMYSPMLFAFSVSSSSASIPVVLNAVRDKLGVDNKIASFVIPVGATINMDGTAIMQGVATVFIAHVFNVPLGFSGYLTVVLMATLASIGTAGVPGVGLITLSMVLVKVGIPVEGIALIFGVDRLLDMLRTAVNISGDAMVACVVGNSERALDKEVYYDGS